MKAIDVAMETRMCYSRAQEQGQVHLPDESNDKNNARGTVCNRRLSIRYYQEDSAWVVSRDLGKKTWCGRCRAHWPELLEDAIAQ